LSDFGRHRMPGILDSGSEAGMTKEARLVLVMPDPGSSPWQALISLPLAVTRHGQARHVVSWGHPVDNN